MEIDVILYTHLEKIHDSQWVTATATAIVTAMVMVTATVTTIVIVRL